MGRELPLRPPLWLRQCGEVAALSLTLAGLRGWTPRCRPSRRPSPRLRSGDTGAAAAHDQQRIAQRGIPRDALTPALPRSDRDSDADGPPSESPSQSGATAALAAHLQRGIATLSSANAALAQFQSFMRGELQQLSSQADTAHQLSTQARSRALALSAATPALAMGRAPPVSPIPQPDFSQAAMDMDALLFGTAPSHVDAGHGSPAGGGAEEQGLTSDKK